MAQPDSFKDFVLDQLQDMRGVTCRRMFGGYGLYQRDTFFGIVYKGQLYFKTDEQSRETYRARGMQFFRPNARQSLKSYYEVPAEIVEDTEQLGEWAKRAIEAQS